MLIHAENVVTPSAAMGYGRRGWLRSVGGEGRERPPDNAARSALDSEAGSAGLPPVERNDDALVSPLEDPQLMLSSANHVETVGDHRR
jgi:hypothetical protein